MRLHVTLCAISWLTMLFGQPGLAQNQKNYGPGVTDTEIKIGQTMPFSGPASSFGLNGKVTAAYFRMINEKGGVNGRKINLIALDDAFSPPKTVEQTRKLVEGEEVLAIVGTIGTAGNIAISKYLNSNKVPQLLVATASNKLNDPANLPWTTVFYLSAENEARIYARWLLKNKPNAKIGVLYQNDDFGKGYLDGLRRGLGDKAAAMIVKEAAYDLTYPTVDSQILQLQASGADTLLHAAIPKFSAQALNKSNELGWKPLHLIVAAAAATIVRMDHVGGDRAKGVISGLYLKDTSDLVWDSDSATHKFRAFVKDFASDTPLNDPGVVMGYSVGEITVEILKRCGNDLTRENLLKQATNVKDLQLSMFIPNVKVNISPEDRAAWRQAQMVQFDGKKWIPIGDILGTDD